MGTGKKPFDMAEAGLEAVMKGEMSTSEFVDQAKSIRNAGILSEVNGKDGSFTFTMTSKTDPSVEAEIKVTVEVLKGANILKAVDDEARATIESVESGEMTMNEAIIESAGMDKGTKPSSGGSWRI